MMGGYWKTGRKDLHGLLQLHLPRTAAATTASPSPPGWSSCSTWSRTCASPSRTWPTSPAWAPSTTRFLDYLRDFRPRCTIEAVPEGTVVFPHEPILQVEGPLIEAQLLETAVLNTLNYQTLIATKAARIRLACGERQPGGVRAAPGPRPGRRAERHAGPPTSAGPTAPPTCWPARSSASRCEGTHAHSWVMSFDDELTPSAPTRPATPSPILLVDTYDTLTSGLPNARDGVQGAARGRTAGARRHPPRLRRPGPAEQGGLPHVHRGRLRRPAHRGLQRARRGPHRRPQAAGRAHQLLGRGHAPHHLVGPPGAWAACTSWWPCSENGGDWEPRIKLSSNPAKMTDPGRKRAGALLRRGRPAAGRHHPPGRRSRRRHRPRPAGQAGAVRRTARPLVLAGRLGRHPLRGPAAAGHAGRRARGPRRRPWTTSAPAASEQVASLPEELRRLRNPEIYAVGLSPRWPSEKVRMSGRPRACSRAPGRRRLGGEPPEAQLAAPRAGRLRRPGWRSPVPWR